MEEIISVFGVNWKLLLFQAVNFGILLWLLHRFLYQPILKLVTERQEKITKGLHDAEEGKKLLASAETERVALLTKATSESNSLVEKARERAKKTEKEILKEAEARSAMQLREAKMAIERERERAFAESKEEIARMAVLGAEKILQEKIS